MLKGGLKPHLFHFISARRGVTGIITSQCVHSVTNAVRTGITRLCAAIWRPHTSLTIASLLSSLYSCLFGVSCIKDTSCFINFINGNHSRFLRLHDIEDTIII